jgi:Domain of unknown function (DUF4440)
MSRFFAAVSALLLVCPVAFAQGAATAATSATSEATSINSAEVRQFQTIEDKWSQAENKHDQFGLDLVLSPLLVNVAENGDITSHNQQVVQAITNDDKLYFLSQKVISVRMLGDIAVVNGTYLLRHHINEKLVTDHGVFTHVYQRQRGGWMCVNAQRTLVSENSVSRKGKEKDKKSSATDLSFHIPFFSKGNKGPQ